MLYSHKNRAHRKLALVIFGVSAIASVLLGIKAIADANSTTNTPTSQTTTSISSNSAPIIQGNTVISTNQSGGFNGINNGVNAPNNSGNINTGPVGGNLTQIVGAPSRKLSDAQIDDIKDAVKPFLGDGSISVGYEMDSEASGLGEQLAEILKSDPSHTFSFPGTGHPVGIEIHVKDANPPPPLADALLTHLQKAGLLGVKFSQHPDWPISDNDKVVVQVYFAPTPSQ